jgi:charged multivesicular body protein 7
MLARLEQVYTSIEQAADQVEIVRIMEASTVVLKGLHAEAGGTERVEDVVEELREEMYKVDEVGKIISEAGDTGLIVDDGEVDDELEAMEQEEKEKKDKTEAQEVESRLAALGRDTPELARTAAEGERKQDAETEKGIEESIAGLEGLSLGEVHTKPKPEKNNVERPTIPAT